MFDFKLSKSHFIFQKTDSNFYAPSKKIVVVKLWMLSIHSSPGFLQSSAGIVRTGVSTGQKGGTGPTNHLNSYSNKTLKALFLLGNQKHFWQLLNMFIINVVNFLVCLTWLCMIWDDLLRLGFRMIYIFKISILQLTPNSAPAMCGQRVWVKWSRDAVQHNRNLASELYTTSLK